jgi:hypothetical protein
MVAAPPLAQAPDSYPGLAGGNGKKRSTIPSSPPGANGETIQVYSCPLSICCCAALVYSCPVSICCCAPLAYSCPVSIYCCAPLVPFPILLDSSPLALSAQSFFWPFRCSPRRPRSCLRVFHCLLSCYPSWLSSLCSISPLILRAFFASSDTAASFYWFPCSCCSPIVPLKTYSSLLHSLLCCVNVLPTCLFPTPG